MLSRVTLDNGMSPEPSPISPFHPSHVPPESRRASYSPTASPPGVLAPAGTATRLEMTISRLMYVPLRVRYGVCSPRRRSHPASASGFGNLQTALLGPAPILMPQP